MRARVGAGAAVGAAAVIGARTLQRRRRDHEHADGDGAGDGRGAADRPADVGFMHAMHGAMRRDLERLTMAGRQPGPAAAKVWEGWELFRREMESHHRAEDEELWPVLRSKLTDVAERQVVADMYEEHARLPDALDAAAAALQRGGGPVSVDGLADVILGHLAHEEEAALPLVEAHLTDAEWHHFLETERRAHSPRERGEFLMWVLDDAAPQHADAVLRELPPPGRFLYRTVLRRVHERRHLWELGHDATARRAGRPARGATPLPA